MKSSLFGCITLALVLLCSCSRDYYCRCTYTYEGVGAPPEAEEIISIKGSKKYAETTCEEHNAEFVDTMGYRTSVVCNLY